MTCRELADFLADYLSDDLSAETRTQFEQHLSRCPNCRQYLADYRATIELGRRAFTDEDAGVPAEVPEVTAERIEHGRTLFMTPGEKGGANCVSCHGPEGRGGGVSAWEPGKEGLEYVKDDWGNEIQPRDLTRGVFRFGRRPVDLYRRIYAGINGTPMPEHIGMTITENGEQRTMTESDIWDLAFFVRTLSTHAPTVGQAPAGHAPRVPAANVHGNAINGGG
jgi:mono/diheme cytochrome c family protein